MRALLRKISNWTLYRLWTPCEHDWHPVGFSDWRCSDCGADR